MAAFAYLPSPLGLLEIVCSDRGISEVNFVNEVRHEETADPPEILTKCKTQLKEYFAGKRKQFSVKLDLSRGTEFYREVWRLVQAIPYGRTRCYSKIAENLGRPNASRAVGLANGRNPLPILVPCHRVIGKNGSLTGYAYGLEMKEALLAIENPRRFAHQVALW